jgi:hypothetical protein
MELMILETTCAQVSTQYLSLFHFLNNIYSLKQDGCSRDEAGYRKDRTLRWLLCQYRLRKPGGYSTLTRPPATAGGTDLLPLLFVSNS